MPGPALRVRVFMSLKIALQTHTPGSREYVPHFRYKLNISRVAGHLSISLLHDGIDHLIYAGHHTLNGNRNTVPVCFQQRDRRRRIHHLCKVR